MEYANAEPDECNRHEPKAKCQLLEVCAARSQSDPLKTKRCEATPYPLLNMKKFIISTIAFIALFGCSQQAIPSNSSPSTVQNSNIENTAENTRAMTTIKFFAEKSPVAKSYQSIQHVGHEPNPDIDVMLEKYDADGDTYLLMNGSTVNKFMDKDINTSASKSLGSKIYSQKELEAMVKNFIKDNTLVDFTKLTTNFNRKGDNYFFVWEYRANGKTHGSLYPSVLVSIRKDGWLFSYEDILNY